MAGQTMLAHSGSGDALWSVIVLDIQLGSSQHEAIHNLDAGLDDLVWLGIFARWYCKYHRDHSATAGNA